ncbi:MAG: DUF4931 domain-containing protein [Candidatus Nealsonbacteria bacterium]|nr:DUF4931 domain-containing protein [Candidatus Nealsonbacteria bacterium]
MKILNSIFKKKKVEEAKFPSELRLDLVSQDWVVIATGRARRPETFKKDPVSSVIDEKEEIEKCFFCNLETQEKPVLISGSQKDWKVAVVPNKFPAFLPHPDLDETTEGGIYKKMNAVGFHEVVITRDHKKHMGQFSKEEIKEVVDAYQSRYLSLMKEKFVNNVSIFHNHGKTAGASVSHPHSQIITTPLVDIDLKNALLKSKAYSEENKECVYCKMNEWELKVKERIVFENDGFIATCPFASKMAFQTIISPKKHLSYFEKINEDEKWQFSEAFQKVLSKICKGLNNPDYNFYLHTAPCDGKNHDYYHWHWTILPKTSTWAGFEIGTRIEISTIEPEKAAEYLRNQ